MNIDKTGKVEVNLEYYDYFKKTEEDFKKLNNEFKDYKSEDLKMVVRFILQLRTKLADAEINEIMTDAGYTFIYTMKNGHSVTIGKGTQHIIHKD